MLDKAIARDAEAGKRFRRTLAFVVMVFLTVQMLPYPFSNSQAAIVGTGDVNPANPETWTFDTTAYIGQSSLGTVTVNDGSRLLSRYGYVGYDAGSSGIVTVTGAGSRWGNDYSLLVGYSGEGTLNVEAGGEVFNAGTIFNSYLGYNSGSTGRATVTGIGSNLTNFGNLYVGNFGTGILTINAGGHASNSRCFLGYGSIGTVTVSGPGSTWTNNEFLRIGENGQGTLIIEDGGEVNNSDDYNDNHLGYQSGSIGTVTVSGSGSKLHYDSTLYVGYLGSGNLTVLNGGIATIDKGIYASLNDLHGNGTILSNGGVLDADLVFEGTQIPQQTLAFGAGGTLNINYGDNYVLGAGYKGTGTLRIAGGSTVACSVGYLGYHTGSLGDATITGAGSKWISNGRLYVGYMGAGTLNIEEEGQVISTEGQVGRLANSLPSRVTISGVGSKWINSGSLYVGNLGGGVLEIKAGGQVSDGNGYLGYGYSQSGNATVSGSGSTWDNTGSFTAGYYSNSIGTLNIEAGGQVTSYSGCLGFKATSNGIVTITGVDSKWLNGGAIIVGDSGKGTLNIESGGLVTTDILWIAAQKGSSGTCNINGGVLKARTVMQISGIGDFNWNDGTIQNFDSNSDLSIYSKLALKLAGTGTHAFNIDPNRIGTVDATVRDATSAGSLKKIGAGTLLLTAVNTYSGGTTVDEGRFKVTGSILNSSGVTVDTAGTLELARTQGNATAGSLPIDNDGLFLVSAGAQTVGAITGSGVTQVNAGASLTAVSIVQDSLVIGSSGAMSAVPEPSMGALLVAGILGALGGWVGHRYRSEQK